MAETADPCTDSKTLITLPAIKWSRSSRPLSQITGNLPRVIKHDASTEAVPMSAQHGKFLREPLIAHSMHDRTKVFAQNLVVTQNEHDRVICRKEILNCPIVVPQNNEAWFSVIDQDNNMPAYTSVEDISLSRVTSFLLTTPLKAKRPNEENDQQFRKVTVPPGTVLNVSRCTSGKRQGSICQYVPVGRFRKKILKYLQCFDENNKVLFVKLKQKGEFYAVTIDGDIDPEKCVMQMRNILELLKFPVDVQCRFGTTPTTTFFTGYLELLYTIRVTVVVATTIKNYHNVIFEIPIDNCPMTFNVAYNDSQLINSSAYLRAFESCEEKLETYLMQMKTISEAFIKQRSNSLPSPYEVCCSSSRLNSEDAKRPVSVANDVDGYFKMDAFRHDSMSTPQPCYGTKMNRVDETSDALNAEQEHDDSAAIFQPCGRSLSAQPRIGYDFVNMVGGDRKRAESEATDSDGYLKMDGFRHAFNGASDHLDIVYSDLPPKPCHGTENSVTSVSYDETNVNMNPDENSDDVFATREHDINRHKLTSSVTFDLPPPRLCCSIDSGMGESYRASDGSHGDSQRDSADSSNSQIFDSQSESGDIGYTKMELDQRLSFDIDSFLGSYSNSTSSTDTVISYENVPTCVTPDIE